MFKFGGGSAKGSERRRGVRGRRRAEMAKEGRRQHVPEPARGHRACVVRAAPLRRRQGGVLRVPWQIRGQPWALAAIDSFQHLREINRPSNVA